jgi:uncharacterized protein (DUF849 family)
LVLIKACLNGSRSQDAHPALPVTPDQLAAAARAVVDAGASAVHIHPRGADGAESSDPDDLAAALEAIRAAVPGLPVGATTGIWVFGDAATRIDRVRSWQVLPDFVSVNWFEDGAEALADVLIAKGVGVEAGLATGVDAWRFAGSPIANDCLRALIEVRDHDRTQAVTLASQMDDALEAAGITVPRLHHGFGEVTWSVLEAAFELGRDVRVGLEDVLTLPDGSPAANNADLVAVALTLARKHGIEPARLD